MPERRAGGARGMGRRGPVKSATQLRAYRAAATLHARRQEARQAVLEALGAFGEQERQREKDEGKRRIVGGVPRPQWTFSYPDSGIYPSLRAQGTRKVRATIWYVDQNGVQRRTPIYSHSGWGANRIVSEAVQRYAGDVWALLAEHLAEAIWNSAGREAVQLLGVTFEIVMAA